MKEENSKLVVTIIVLASLLLSVYLSAVVVAVVNDVSITTVIHNWQAWTLDFLKSLIEQKGKNYVYRKIACCSRVSGGIWNPCSYVV